MSARSRARYSVLRQERKPRAERGLGLWLREAWRRHGRSLLLRRCSIASPDAWLLSCGVHSRFPSSAGSLPRAELCSDGVLRPLSPFVSFGVLVSLLIYSISPRLSLPCKMQGCLSVIYGLKSEKDREREVPFGDAFLRLSDNLVGCFPSFCF